MPLLSRVLYDARADAATVPTLPTGTELQLRHAAQMTQQQAVAWQQKRPQEGALTALLDLPEAARLNVPAWLKALQPDTVELRTPAWSPAGLQAIGWPEGAGVLDQNLQHLGQLGQDGKQLRLALHVSALTLEELTGEALGQLARQSGQPQVQVVLRPVLGAHAPRLDRLAELVAALTQTTHQVTATRLFPMCALPLGVDGEATFASERTAARQEFRAECTDCPARAEGRCDGMAADLLTATLAAGGTWTGWTTWERERQPPVASEPDERLEEVEEIAIRLGLRKVWRSELPLAEAEALGAHLPDGLQAILGLRTTLNPEKDLRWERPEATWQIQYLAPDVEDAEAARAAELTINAGDPQTAPDAHRKLAELLGYPKCCVDAFLQDMDERALPQWAGVAENAFAMLRAARRSENLDRRLEFNTPVDDGCLVRHTPCRLDCAESLAQVQKIEDELEKIAPKRMSQKRKLRADGVLLFADSAEIPLRGVWQPAETGAQLTQIQPLETWQAGYPRARIAERALAAVRAQLEQAVALEPTHPLEGPGGVTVVLADGTRQPLESPGVPQHPQFPRLVVFAREGAPPVEEVLPA